MTLTQQQAIDMIQQYKELGLDIKYIIDGTAHILANADIDSLIDAIQRGAFCDYYCGLRTMLLKSPVGDKFDTLISIDNAA